MIKLTDLLSEKIKPRQKISKKEWSKIKKFNKHIGQDGTHYVTQLDKKLGTILVPVIVGLGLDLTKSRVTSYWSPRRSILKHSVPGFIKSNLHLMKMIKKINYSEFDDNKSGSFEIYLNKIKE